MESYYWLVLMAVLIIIEIVTLGLTTIWFAFGSLAAYIANLCGGNLIVQIVVFFVVSVVTLIFTRPIAVKYFNKERIKTNAESLIGEKAKVIEKIDDINATGRVVVKGQEWMARTESESIVEVDSIVLIKCIKGAKLIVEKSN